MNVGKLHLTAWGNAEQAWQGRQRYDSRNIRDESWKTPSDKHGMARVAHVGLCTNSEQAACESVGDSGVNNKEKFNKGEGASEGRSRGIRDQAWL
jgi:hypothetical protein